MLKAVVEQMKLRTESRLGEMSGLVTIFADDDRHLQLARDEKWLVAELLRQAARDRREERLWTAARSRARGRRT